MKIDVVIPNYNGSALLEKNIPAVLSVFKNRNNTKIYIVDDASSEIEKEKLRLIIDKTQSKKIQLIESEENKGFSSTVNLGVRESDADLVVLLNSDAVPEPDFLDPIIKRFEEDNSLFGVGCMDKSIEDGKVVLRGRGVAEWKKGFLKHRRGEVTSEDTFWISGGSSVVDRKKFTEIGGFDEIFNPFYWEDIDLSYRAQKAGYKIVFEKNSVVTHRHNEGAIKSHYTQQHIKKIAFRNELFFIWKNITDTRLQASHILYLIKYFLTSLIKADMYVIFGTVLALKRVPDIIAKRQTQKKYFKLSDHEILNKNS